MEEVVCTVCHNVVRHVGPCDGMGYQGSCAMCSGFVQTADGTLLHEDGTLFAPVKIIQERHYEVQLPMFLRTEVNDTED